MKHKPTLTIRMGAAEWSVTALHNNTEYKLDMRKIDTKTQRQAIFKCVEAFRIMRDKRLLEAA